MTRIFLSKADISSVEEEYVLNAIRSGWVAPLGPHVDAFELEIAERVGVAGALALSSGTAALHLALLNLGAGPGTAVVCSTMTFAASANAIAYTGAEPVFVDSGVSDGNVNPTLLMEAVDAMQSEGTRVVAAMVVDLFGRCADYDTITAGLGQRGVPLLEDAAEALGARRDGKAAGSFGAAAALSFNGNKIMTTSGGGMLLSDDLDLIDRARYMATQARQPVPWYEHTEIGYNYRLSNICAALGRGQLSRLDDMVARRRSIRQRYVAGLGSLGGLTFLGPEQDHDQNSWLTAVLLDQQLTLSPAELIGLLDSADIEARYLWKPMHLQPAFAGARSSVDGSSEDLFSRGLTLPSGSALSDDQVDLVVDIIGKAIVNR